MPRRTKAEIEAAKRRSEAAWRSRIKSTYGITADEYYALYEFQNGRCAIYGCRATGKTRRLSIDHDHKCSEGHDPAKGCRSCIRGLVCSTHNQWFGHAGDNPAVFESAAEYLRNPPWRHCSMIV